MGTLSVPYGLLKESVLLEHVSPDEHAGPIPPVLEWDFAVNLTRFHNPLLLKRFAVRI